MTRWFSSLCRAGALALLLTLLCNATSTRAAAPFELKDGDRVVFLGDTLIEREQHYGWIELMLTSRFPDRDITFRNLGWGGDTPAGAPAQQCTDAGKDATDPGRQPGSDHR